MNPTPAYDGLPPYDDTYEDASPDGFGVSEKSANGSAAPPTLPAQLRAVREQRIRSLLDTYIQPLMTEQGLSGLYKTICVLIPSNVATLNHTSGNDETVAGVDHQPEGNTDMVLGFPAEDHIKLVRLKGDENKLEFWRQVTVLDQLATELRSRLRAAGHRLYDPSQSNLPPPPPPTSPVSSKGNGGGGWGSLFRRKTGGGGSNHKVEEQWDPYQGLSADGWKAHQHPSSSSSSSSQRRKIRQGEVHVEVGVDVISLRVLNDFGLWETRSGNAMTVMIEVGG